MDDSTVLVLADPAAPELAMLEALPDTTSIAVGRTPEAFEHTAPRADVILNAEADAKAPGAGLADGAAGALGALAVGRS